MFARADARGVDLAVFPELGISSYAIDDLLLQDALLDAVEAAIARLVAASRDARAGARRRRAAAARRAALQLRGGASHRGRVLGVVPKTYPAQLPRILREALVRLRRRGRARRRCSVGRAERAVRHRPDVRRRPTSPTSSSTSRSARISGRRSRRRTSRALAGATDPAQPLGQQHHDRQGGRAHDCSAPSQSGRCIAAYVYSAAGPGESTTDLAWDGQALIYELGELLAETERFAREPEMAVADIDVERLRLERMRTNTFGDNARRSRPAGAALPPGRLRARACRRRASRCDGAVERFPYVPTDPARLRRAIATRRTTSRSQGLAQRLQATGRQASSSSASRAGSIRPRR